MIENWNKFKLDNICTLITDGTHHTPTYLPEGVPFLSVKNLTNGKIDFSNTRFISPKISTLKFQAINGYEIITLQKTVF